MEYQKNLDIAKRKVAHDILASDKDLQVIFFLMPNGDLYMEEPYSRQQNQLETILLTEITIKEPLVQVTPILVM